MADRIAFLNGRHAFAYAAAAGPAWHRKGVVLDERLVQNGSGAEMAAACGVGFEMGLRDLWVAYGPEDGLGRGGRLRQFKALVKLDDGDVFSTSVTPRYNPIQPATVFDTVAAAVRDNPGASFDCGGGIDNGRRVWGVVKLAEDDVITGDRVRKYLYVGTVNDGTGAFNAVDTDVRVVCWNTDRSMRAAEGDRIVKIRHTASADERIAQLSKAIASQASSFSARIDQYRAWSRKAMPAAHFEQYVAAVVPDGSATPKHVAKVRATIAALARQGRGTDIVGVRGTLWGAYNAATEFVSQVRSTRRDADAAMSSILFGSGAEIIERAERLAAEYAGT